MLFNSIEFALFLPIVFILYWFVFNKRLGLQNLFIVAVSYLFYGWWDWHFLLLMAFTTTCSWLSGVLIEKHRTNYENGLSKTNWAKVISITNIVLNLGILGIYKYYNFFVASFIEAFGHLGIQLHPSSLNLILPVGISFYTFQALSYSIDVYRKDLAATKDAVSFFAFVSFFPQLVAGPIERATNLLPQFHKPRTFDYNKAVDGMRQILWGLFKKIVIADNCATYVNQIFDNYEIHTGSTLLLAAILFAFQIYGDFSGYSDIAIGTSRLFGINLMRNFAFPYFSRDIAEFWRRWHISLSTWFRDYLYIPLGGSRGGKCSSIRNTMIIFIVSGFWHGANWTFVAWGAFHGLLFLPLLIGKKNRKHTNIVAENKFLPSPIEFIQIASTFLLVVIGWVFFRAESIQTALKIIFNFANTTLFSKPFYVVGLSKTVMFVGLLLLVEWIQRKKLHGLEIDTIDNGIIKWSIYYLVIAIILEFGANSQSFNITCYSRFMVVWSRS